MVEGVRNAMRDSCDECGKKVVYEKDADSGLSAVEVEPMVWKELCEDCYDAYREREKRLDADEDEVE